MKYFVLIKLIVFLTCLTISCVGDQSYELPDLELPEVNPKGSLITFRALRAALEQEMLNNQNEVLTIQSELYLIGYVISSDEHGNFFEELILQDEPANPLSGLRVLIDSSPLFPAFEPGRKVYVQLRGLTIGIENGQLTLGMRDGNRIRHVAESRMFDYLMRTNELTPIDPMDVKISELNINQINTCVRFSQVQFNRNQVLGEDPLTYSGEPEDQFDGERILESCRDESSIVFSTSTFADFSSVTLPAGSGEVEGIFTYNFFGDEFNIVVNGLQGVKLDNIERCDPAEVNCGVATVVGSGILFSDDFEAQQEGEAIKGNGWTNYIEAGTESWEAYTANGSNASLGVSVRAGSYQSGDERSVAWLISPLLDFDQQEGETLTFRTSNSFADGSTLELLFSSDWNGDPGAITASTWELMPAAILVQDKDYFGDWIFSGLVDLSCIDGTGSIAWRYEGSGDEDLDGTYELDDVEIRYSK